MSCSVACVLPRGSESAHRYVGLPGNTAVCGFTVPETVGVNAVPGWGRAQTADIVGPTFQIPRSHLVLKAQECPAAAPASFGSTDTMTASE